MYATAVLASAVVAQTNTNPPENIGTPSTGKTKWSTAMCHKNTE